MKNHKTISVSIRLFREVRGLTQKKMAEKLGITQQAYSNLEKKPEKATIQRLREIAKILQIGLITLLCEEDSGTSKVNITPQGEPRAKLTLFEKEIYDKLIATLKEEIVFLRELQLSKK